MTDVKAFSWDDLQETCDFLKNHSGETAKTAIVLGSGLGLLMDHLTILKRFAYGEIPHFPISTVVGHSGELVMAEIDSKRLWIMNGRFHYYEGYGMSQVVYPLRVLKLLGVENLVVTNAAGGLNADFEAGDIMLIEDVISLLPANPLRGKNDNRLGPRFPDMSAPLDEQWSAQVKESALELGYNLKSGVYVGVTGPNLETKAEINYLRIIGGDAVGMSTVPEIICAHQMGIRVLAISVITNESIPKSAKEFTHEEVVEVAGRAGVKLVDLVKSNLP
ncbi:purine-nucleoside phosphorylase [Arthrospiribacter ruber]|uniref:Purine nucleoside phosphorylase n=1 Tax=Arthrospiribacter ruber TaxID=2487934 RepID=A0A951J036_9BACT|nr:purine-nucleoside phosphorylase [Arthrospiribacter ruber]MBW3468872.1 purine-nucleoside phosphorylase [Arthrospiribacter ruber]